jgi:uncharacterized glyoxalase superfamily protein PhnB
LPALKAATPILFVSDVSATAAYFRDQLGFEIGFLYGEPPYYGAVSRGEACLHLRFVHAPVFRKDLDEESLIVATIEVDDVAVLFAELKARGAMISQPLQKQAWGGTDFYVRDLDGNQFSFVEFRAAS